MRFLAFSKDIFKSKVLTKEKILPSSSSEFIILLYFSINFNLILLENKKSRVRFSIVTK